MLLFEDGREYEELEEEGVLLTPEVVEEGREYELLLFELDGVGRLLFGR